MTTRDLPASAFTLRRPAADRIRYYVTVDTTDGMGRPIRERFRISSMSAAMAEDDVRAATGGRVVGYAARA